MPLAAAAGLTLKPSFPDACYALSAAQEMLPGSSPLQLCQMYWGMGLIMGLDEAPQPLRAVFDAVGSVMPSLAASGALPESLQRQVFQGFLAAKMVGHDALLPVPLLETMKRSWVAKVRRALNSFKSS